MSLLRRTYLCHGLRSAPTVAAAAAAATATHAPLASSRHLWESATRDFYSTYAHFTQHSTSSDVLPMLRTAEIVMRRCLAEHRAEEALEVYATLCRCGVAGMALGERSAATATSIAAPSSSLDQLAQEAMQRVPHRAFQHSVLGMMMAAEVDGVAAPTTLLYPEREENAAGPSPRAPPHWEKERSTTTAALSLSTPLLLNGDAVSAAEQARIRIRQRLHTLHSTGQLRQPLGKEYCLVEMQELATKATAAAAGTAAASVRNDLEVAPLCTLAQCVLHHPFSFATPSAVWAQRELLWETDVGRGSGDVVGQRWSSQAYSPADVTRLLQLDRVVRPYRALCRIALDFLVACVPDWDALFVRRVAETLLLPAAAHVVFPADYHRNRRGGSGDRAVHGTTATTAWTDASTHRLFCQADAVSVTGSPVAQPFLSRAAAAASPLARVEAILRRRLHHDVVVPDTAYVIHNFHQLRQLARHREVVISHAVLLDLVAAAARMDNPLRFHIRRVLREVMYATTTAVSAAAQWELLAKERSGRGGGLVATGQRRSAQVGGGYTLLGLQDELALLDGCPERFFLQECLQEGSSHSSSSSVSVVLVARQLERMIAAHDRGEDFAPATAHNSSSGSGTSRTLSGDVHINVDDLVHHLLSPPVGAEAATSGGRAEPLFRSRSRGRWARLPMLVATTSTATRAAAFQVGLRMHPPAGVAP